MFELLTKTKTKLRDIVVLSQKNRQPDDNPGAKLSVEMKLANSILAYFDGALRGFLFTKDPAPSGLPKRKGGQGELEEVQPISEVPDLTSLGSKIGSLHWDDESTGYTFVVDYGLGGKASNLELPDCKLSNWRITPEKGGTVAICFDIESNDVSEKAFGRLAKLKSREIEVLLLPPEVTQDDLDPDPVLTPAQLRAANAKGQTIAQAQEEAKGAPKPVKEWPFPPGGEGSGPGQKSQPPKDTPKDATEAVLADVKKHGAAGKPAAKKTAPAKKTAAKRKTAAVA